MRSRTRFAPIIVFVTVFAFEGYLDNGVASGQDDDRWSDSFTPTNYNVPEGSAGIQKLVSYNGGLYVGGTFNQADGKVVGGIAVWDGAEWQDVADGIHGEILSLVEFQGYLVAGGRFRVSCLPHVVDLASWDGTSWAEIPSGKKVRSVEALASGSDGLYAVAYFDGLPRVGRWDGTNWTFLGEYFVEPFAQGQKVALLADRQTVYAGFYGKRKIGDVQLSAIGRWNGQKWSNMLGGLSVSSCTYGNCGPYTSAIARAPNGEIVVVGKFSSAGSIPSNSFAEWHGSWGGFPTQVRWVADFLLDGPDVYWSGSASDSALGTFLETPHETTHLTSRVASSFVKHGDAVVMGVDFHGLVRQLWPNVEQLGELTSTIGQGLGGRGEAIIVAPDGSVVALGVFGKAGEARTDQLARWDGAHWSPLLSRWSFRGSSRVFAATYLGEQLYVGGKMEQWPGVYYNVARISGKALEHLGNGDVDGTVHALASNEHSVYIGGEFLNAGGRQARHIVEWTGESWQPLGDGVDGSVLAIEVSGDEVVAGGEFTMAGGTTVPAIATWKGGQWLPLGDGLDGVVRTIVRDGNSIFAGGSFRSIKGPSLNNVAVWRDGEWHAFGTGLNGEVQRLAISDAGWLYAAGRFTSAGGKPANYVAAWDGREWHALGSGVNGTCMGVAATEGRVYFTGYFLKAGGRISHYFAEWAEIGSPTVSIRDVTIEAGAGRIDVSWELDPLLSVQGLNVYRSSNGSGWSRLTNSPLPSTAREFVDEEEQPERAYTYELGVVRRNGSEQRVALGQTVTQPLGFSLGQNYPNPFNPFTTIVYTVPRSNHVRIEIFDATGSRVRRLVDDVQDAGTRTVTWDGENEVGQQVAAGVYLYRLTIGSNVASRKMILVK